MADILPYLQSLDQSVREKLLSLFATMPDSLRERCSVRNLKKDSILASPLDRSNFVYVLTHGSIRTVNQDASGNNFVVADFTAPALFGEFELIAGCPFYRGTLIATADCQIIAIERESYLAWVQGNGEVLFQRASAVTRQLLEQCSKERNFLSLRGTERLMLLLCRYYKRNATSGTVRICATRQEMADEIGTSVKTVSRGLQRLTERGLVHLEDRGIAIRKEDYESLRTLVEKELLSNPLENGNLDF
jgi:CRP/FNR family transcriptional regulator, cyclic AMP receptor protein